MEKNGFIQYNKATIHLIFAKLDKQFAKFDLGQGSYFGMQELKAINKKCEELGWLDDIIEAKIEELEQKHKDYKATIKTLKELLGE